MFARYFWWSLVGLGVSLFILVSTRSAPHLRSASPATDLTSLITTITSFITAITALIGAIQKFWPSNNPPTPQGSSASATPQPLVGGHEYHGGAYSPNRRRYRQGEIVEFVRIDRTTNAMNWSMSGAFWAMTSRVMKIGVSSINTGNSAARDLASMLDGDPGRIRTCNPQSRNLMLYPVELRDP